MKIKNVIITIVIIVSLILLSSCKTAGGGDTNTPKQQGVFVLSNASGVTIYSNPLNLTSLVLTATVKSSNQVGGRISAFRFVIKSGNITLVEVNSTNYKTWLCSLWGELYIPALQASTIQVKHGNNIYYPGWIFGNYYPNNMDVFITILDDNGYTTTVSGNVNFVYTEI